MTSHPFPRIEISCLEHRAESIRLMQRQFHALHAALRASESSIKAAISADIGYSDLEIELQYSLAIADLRSHYENLDLEKDNASRSTLCNPSATTSIGIVYVQPSRKDLFYSVIAALTAALAAGNCVIVELPTTLSQVSSLLRKLLVDTLDADIFSVSDTRPPDDFLSRCFVLDQTKISSDARDREDGQIAPAGVVAIVDRTANIKDAARDIGMARLSFGGGATYAPDRVLVDEFVAEDFLSHITQAVTAPLLGVSKARRSAQNEQVANSAGMKTVVSGANGAIVEVIDRDKLPSQKVRTGVITVCRTTSLDDAIEASTSGDSSTGGSLECCYVFAAPNEAKFVANSVGARICFINHVPAEILVGPIASNHPRIPPSPNPRYSREVFRFPNPRYTKSTVLANQGTTHGKEGPASAIRSWSKSVLSTTLPPIKQKDGEALGFFDQAFIVFGITALSTLSLSGFAIYRSIR